MVDEKNYKDLVIYFTRYVHNKSIKILRLYYDELIRYVEEREGKKYLVVYDYMLDIVLDKVKKIIDIKNFDNTKILIGTDDKLPDDITFKNVIIITFVVKDDGKFYPQVFFEERLLIK